MSKHCCLNAAEAEACGCLAVVKVADSGENPPMQAKRKAPAAPRRVLVIDVGGSHVKFRVGAHGPIEEFDLRAAAWGRRA